MSTAREIEAVLRSVESALRDGRSADDVAQMLYAPDLFVVGEGASAATSGLSLFMPEFRDIVASWGPQPACRFTLFEPCMADGRVAVTFVEFHPPGGQEHAVLRAMYGWRRTDAGWRVAMEMYGAGGLAVPSNQAMGAVK